MRKKQHKSGKREGAIVIREIEPRERKEAGGERVAKVEAERPRPQNMAEARERVIDAVLEKAEAIARALAKCGSDGQLAHAKYLFELAGIHPAGEKLTGKPEESEESATYNLLKRHGFITGAEDVDISGQKEDGIDDVK